MRTVVTEVGRARPVAPSVAGVALDLVTLAGQAAALREPTARLHVAVVHGADRLRLLLYDAADSPVDSATHVPSRQQAAGERGWQELVDGAGGGVSVEHVAGWGTLVRADLPYEQVPQRPWRGSAGGESARHADPTVSPFTPRERQVAGLLADGLSDRALARRLEISPKTVEKHVGALLRKTGTNSRTAAVMRALERGWLPPATHPVGNFPHSPTGGGAFD